MSHGYFRFAEAEVQFECRYPRQIDIAEHQFDVSTNFQPQPIINTGDLSYDLTVNVADVGDMSTITITPNHSIAGVVAS